MRKVNLNKKQQELKKAIESNLALIKKREVIGEELDLAMVRMSEASHQLHLSLNPEPKHHRKMIENRGMEPTDPNFYHHIHPVEDLLAYLDDIHANDDLEDLTIGLEFELTVYSAKIDGYRDYKMIRTENGWSFCHLACNGECDKDGHPLLFQALRHDSIKYPIGLDLYIGWVWENARNRGISREEVQKAFDQLGEWVSLCEKNAPRSSFWEGM